MARAHLRRHVDRGQWNLLRLVTLYGHGNFLLGDPERNAYQSVPSDTLLSSLSFGRVEVLWWQR